MTFFRYQQQKSPLPEEGYYFAKIKGCKEGKPRDTVMGQTPTAFVNFELENGLMVPQSILVYWGPTSLFEKLVNVTLGEDVDKVEPEDLIGKTCAVEIRHNHVEDKTYANVVDVFPESELETGDEVVDEDEGNWLNDMDDM
ncbi:hypothetical protein [Brevibacillus agri]|uniref:hypothetical protein n=1 Tax=Brevibacillus agri TaxID=51101 RepID=UPI003D1BA8DE